MSNSTVDRGKESQVINSCSESFDQLSESNSQGAAQFGQLVDAVGGFVLSIKQMDVAMLNAAQEAAQFANKLAQIDFSHAMFGYEWEVRFKNILYEDRQNKITAQRLKVEAKQIELDIINANISIANAAVQADSAALAQAKAAFAMQEAALKVESANNAVQAAILQVREAVLKSAMADVEYEKKIFELKLGLLKAKKGAVEAEKNFKDQMAKLFEPWTKLDDAASKYVKTLGGNVKMMQDLKKDALEVVNSEHLESKFNISAEELVKIQMEYNKELGRNIRMTKDQMKGLAAMKSLLENENTIKMASALDHFGYDFYRSSKLTEKMYKESSQKGIAFGKASQVFLDNIKMADEYTFSKGVDGFVKMAEKAAAIKMNMSEVGKASDKMATLQGAAEASVQLGNLGGSFARFSNPLSVLKAATMNMEDLTGAIEEMFGDLAKFDKEKGEISMSPENLYKMKIASQAMGMDSNAMSDMAFNSARRKQLEPQVNNLGISDNLKELLKNTAQLDKEGNGYFNYKGKKTSLKDAEKLDPKELEAELKIQTQDDSKNLADITTEVRGVKDITDGWNKSLDDRMCEYAEESGFGANFNEGVVAQTANKAEMATMGEQIVTTNKELADKQKEYSEKNAEWEGKMYDSKKGLLKVERDKTFQAQRQASTAARQAALNYTKAVKFEPWQARITKQQAANGVKSAAAAQMAAGIAVESYGIECQQYDLDKEKLDTEKLSLKMEVLKLGFAFQKENTLDNTALQNRQAMNASFELAQAQSKLAALKLGSGGETKDIYQFLVGFETATKKERANANAVKESQKQMKDLLEHFNNRKWMLDQVKGELGRLKKENAKHLKEVKDMYDDGAIDGYGFEHDDFLGHGKSFFTDLEKQHPNDFQWDDDTETLIFTSKNARAIYDAADSGGGFIQEYAASRMSSIGGLSYPDNYPYPIIDGNGNTKGVAALQGGEFIVNRAATKANLSLLTKINNGGGKPIGAGFINSNDVDTPAWWADIDYSNPSGPSSGYIYLNLNGNLFSLSESELISSLKEDNNFKRGIAKTIYA